MIADIEDNVPAAAATVRQRRQRRQPRAAAAAAAPSRLASSYKITTLMASSADQEQRGSVVKLLHELTSRGYDTRTEFLEALARLKRRYKLGCKNSHVRQVYMDEVKNGRIASHPQMLYFFRTKVGKSASGILSITVFTSPYPQYTDKHGNRRTQRFTCEWNCYFCPNHPNHARSYLPDEPGCLRAERCGFDAAAQLTERVATLEHIGHPVDKLEVLVLGGTWESYPSEYQEEYVRDLFWAANTFFDEEPRRERRTLPEEQLINESTKCKIIGLTLETRPDTINAQSIRRFRYYGCTRLQIGLQHIDNRILELVNRRHDVESCERALRMLKNNGYKVDIHLMPDLPGSSPRIDRAMFRSLLGVHDMRTVGDHEYEYDLVNKGIQADQWKVYPCEVTPWTMIEKWFERGEYRPYGGEGPDLVEVLIDLKTMVFPWIRLNRIVRDIPNQHILGGNATVNLRQDVVRIMKQRGLRCKCIRCREVGLNSSKMTVDDIANAVLVSRRYEANDGVEYFLSYETPDERILFGFVRLRIPSDAAAAAAADDDVYVYPMLRGAGLIRELHVYGQLIPTYRLGVEGEESSQHSGFGWRLMRKAEEIAWSYNCKRTAVIAGIGTRNYYRKLGYHLRDTFMVLERPWMKAPRAPIIVYIAFLLCAIASYVIYYAMDNRVTSRAI